MRARIRKGYRINPDPLTIESYKIHNTQMRNELLPLWPQSPYGLSDKQLAMLAISNLADG